MKKGGGYFTLPKCQKGLTDCDIRTETKGKWQNEPYGSPGEKNNPHFKSLVY